MDCPLSKELCDHIISSRDVKYTTIERIGPIEDIKPYIVIRESDNLFIGITKKNYLRLFKEVHTYWHEQILTKEINYEELIEKSSQEELLTLYYFTIGYMLTTHENHSIINIHELVVMELYKTNDKEFSVEFIENEIHIILTFISSRLSKINKSSSLWFWLKKLTIWTILDPLISGKDVQHDGEILILKSFRSCQLHFANYYANNFLRWLSGILLYVTISIDNQVAKQIANKLLELEWIQLKTICHSNLSDSSTWGLMEYQIKQQGQYAYNMKIVLDEYNRIIGILNNNGIRYINVVNSSEFTSKSKSKSNTSGEIDHIILSELKWLVDIDCSVLTPFVSLIRPMLELKYSIKSITTVESIVNSKVQDLNKLLEEHPDDKLSGWYAKQSDLVKLFNKLISLLQEVKQVTSS
ncbi:uncharacterized protein RJT21DRAFT_5567 [Scheffersomyces amazonensis]|uniref:uncharacterized protein n=1 Tax=Scheffersomyces amazonensis TaxID=1078765 RepID=UPI00315D68DC